MKSNLVLIRETEDNLQTGRIVININYNEFLAAVDRLSPEDKEKFNRGRKSERPCEILDSLSIAFRQIEADWCMKIFAEQLKKKET